jgi:hypothetical protein
MMSLTSSSTLTDALNQYKDNLSWEGSPDKAVLALEAVRYILTERPNQLTKEGRSINYESLAAEKKRLEAYVQSAGTTSTAARCSFVRARGVSS